MTTYMSDFRERPEGSVPRPAWVEVDMGAISRNIDRIKNRLAPGCEFCAVVKANAYGHGQRKCMGLLMAKGITRFAVATIEEALLARELCPGGMVYILGLVEPQDYGIILENNITLGICEMDDARLLSEAAVKAGKRSPVFAVVNTGMNRLGFIPEDPATEDCIGEISRLPGLELLGLMSHFSSSDEFDEAGDEYTEMQLQRFETLRARLVEKGVPLPFNTLANSAAALLLPRSHYQMARPGGSIFGDYADGLPPELGIEYCMSLKAKIMHLKWLPKGSAIGYGRHTELKRDSLIGTLNLGYADGIPRIWSCEKGYVLVHGVKAPIVGVVCMDQMMIDVTDVPDVKRFDIVTLMGEDGDLHIRPEEIGEICGGIFDTTVIGLAQRLPYKYIES